MNMEYWLEARFGDVGLTSDREDLRVNCPFCKARNGRADVKRHLYVSLVKPVAHCFRCSWKGHWLSLVMSVEGCSYADALGYMVAPSINVAEFDNPISRLYSPRGLINVKNVVSMPDGFRMLTLTRDGATLEGMAIYNYVRQRLYGVSRKFGYHKQFITDIFGWIPGSNRVWILIDENWWQGRTIVNAEPKYLSPPWPIGDSLWNGGALKGWRRRKGMFESFNEIVICEGVFSAMHVGPNAVALCAKTSTVAQTKRIAGTRVQKIIIMLDADAADESYKLARDLVSAGYAGELVIHHLCKGDPCDGLKGDAVAYGFRSQLEHVFESV